MVMVIVRVNPNLAYNYDYTAHRCILTHCKYVHNALQMDALSEVLPNLQLLNKSNCRPTVNNKLLQPVSD